MELLNNILSRLELLVGNGLLLEADKLSAESLKIYPHHISLLQYRGVILAILNRDQEAIKCYERVLKKNPNNLDCAVNMASSLNVVGENYRALALLDAVISRSSQHFEAHYNKGNVLNDLGRSSEAIKLFEHAISIRSDDKRAHHNLAKCLHDLGRHEMAIIEYDKTLSLDPSYAEAWSNKGVTLLQSKKYADAMVCFNKSIDLEPGFAAAYSNKGLALHALNNFDDAIAQFNKAISLDPNYAEAHLNKSFSELILGRYLSGFKNFEYRWKAIDFGEEEYTNIPRLSSIDHIVQKKILIWSEQGLGDTIQFFRYVLLLCDLGADIVFKTPELVKAILPVRDNLAYITKVTEESFDFQLPLLSLPMIFRTCVESIPNCINFIDVSRDKFNFFSDIVASEKKLKIGLVCSGQKNHRNDSNRSIPLHLFDPIFDEKYQYFLIQKEVRPEDEEFLQRGLIQNMAHYIKDFSDTAAIIENLDLVICVDTSVLHLAGTLEKKSFLLLPFCPDWRWQVDRIDTPWYPSVKIIRQTSPDDWHQVICDLKAEIESLVG
jgi:tetratricopeptide (TPR) repeat protein